MDDKMEKIMILNSALGKACTRLVELSGCPMDDCESYNIDCGDCDNPDDDKKAECWQDMFVEDSTSLMKDMGFVKG